MFPTPILEIDLITFAVGGLVCAVLLMILLPLMERWRIDIRIRVTPTELIVRPEPPQLPEQAGETVALVRRGSVR